MVLRRASYPRTFAVKVKTHMAVILHHVTIVHLCILYFPAVLVHVLKEALAVQLFGLLLKQDLVLVCTLCLEIVFTKLPAPMARSDH